MAEELVSTGLNQLDAFLGGGLQAGSTIMLVAPTGAGAEIFAKQFAAGPKSSGDHVNVFVSTDESEEDVRRAVEFFGFPGRPKVLSIADIYYNRILERERSVVRPAPTSPILGVGRQWLTTPPDAAELPAVSPITMPDPSELDMAPEAAAMNGNGHEEFQRELFQTPANGHQVPVEVRWKEGRNQAKASASEWAEELHHRLFQPYKEVPAPSRFTVQSLDFFSSFMGPERILETAIALKTANDRCRGLQLLVLTKGALDPLLERRLETIADCLIELEFARKATQLEKYFVVKNVKNRHMGVGVTPYQITRRGFQLDDLNRIL